MKRILFILALFLLASLYLCAKDDNFVGKVFLEQDSLPLAGTLIEELSNNNKVVNGVISDIDGNFYLPLKQIPTKVRIRYIGCETIIFEINHENVKEKHAFYMEDDKNVICCPDIVEKQNHKFLKAMRKIFHIH